MSKNIGVAGGLRRGFLACIIVEIAKSRCVSYFSTVPKTLHKLQSLWSRYEVEGHHATVREFDTMKCVCMA